MGIEIVSSSNQLIPFELSVVMGKKDGYSKVDKFGINPTIEPATDPEDIWEFGGVYTFDDFGTTAGLYVSSSSSSDAGKTIVVQGLDITGELVTQEVTLLDQANVTLPTPLWRTFRMYNSSDSDFVGTVYCHNDTTPTDGVPDDANVRAIVVGEKNQTLMCIYCVPKGKVGFLYRGEIGLELEGNAATLAEYSHCHYESRRFGKTFRVKKSLTLIAGGSSTYQDERSFPDVIPALTDIRLRVQIVTQAMGMWGTFDILLVDEDKFSDEYLAQIGQPGY